MRRKGGDVLPPFRLFCSLITCGYRGAPFFGKSKLCGKERVEGPMERGPYSLQNVCCSISKGMQYTRGCLNLWRRQCALATSKGMSPVSTGKGGFTATDGKFGWGIERPDNILGGIGRWLWLLQASRLYNIVLALPLHLSQPLSTRWRWSLLRVPTCRCLKSSAPGY